MENLARKILMLLCLVHAGAASAAGPQPCYFAGAFTKCFTTSGILVPQISWTDTTKGIVGTTTNDSAAAGYVGEIFLQSRVNSAAASVTTGTTLNITSTKITVTAGDYLICGSISFNPAAGTSVTVMDGAISKTSATLPASATLSVPTAGEIRIEQDFGAIIPGAGNLIPINIPCYRGSFSGSQDLYLVANATFTVSTLTAFGSFWAMRMR